MSSNTRKEAFLATLEFVLDGERKHYIYPMKLKDMQLIQDLFAKFNDEYIILNLPAPLVDEQGKFILTEDGEEIINTEPYDAMMEVLEMALKQTAKEIEEWIDLSQVEEILAKYRRISGLLKKKQEMERGLHGMF